MDSFTCSISDWPRSDLFHVGGGSIFRWYEGHSLSHNQHSLGWFSLCRSTQALSEVAGGSLRLPSPAFCSWCPVLQHLERQAGPLWTMMTPHLKECPGLPSLQKGCCVSHSLWWWGILSGLSHHCVWSLLFAGNSPFLLPHFLLAPLTPQNLPWFSLGMYNSTSPLLLLM